MVHRDERQCGGMFFFFYDRVLAFILYQSLVDYYVGLVLAFKKKNNTMYCRCLKVNIKLKLTWSILIRRSLSNILLNVFLVLFFGFTVEMCVDLDLMFVLCH